MPQTHFGQGLQHFLPYPQTPHSETLGFRHIGEANQQGNILV